MAVFTKTLESKSGVLTKSQKGIAGFISENKAEAAFHTLEEFAAKAGVSTATVVRFSKALGLSGYSEMQSLIREEIYGELEESDKKDNQPAAAPRIEKIEPSDREPVKELAAAIKKTKACFADLDPEEVSKAADAIFGARTVFVLGMRESYSTAVYFASGLSKIRQDVRLIRSDGMGYPEQISGAGEGDVMVAFFYPRYSRDAAAVLSTVRQAGAMNILFTDSDHKAAGIYGDIFLPCGRTDTYFGHSYAAPVMVSDWLIDAVYLKDPAAAGTRKTDMEDMLEDSLYLRG